MKKVKEEVPPPQPSKRIYSPWYYNKKFRYLVGTVLFLTVIFLITQVQFLLTPFLNFFSAIFPPLAISFLFYYLLRPIVYFFESKGFPRILTIIVLYIILAILLIVFLSYLVPILGSQITAIANISVKALENLPKTPLSFELGKFSINLEYEIQQKIIAILQEATSFLSKNLLDWLGVFTHIAIILVAIPFILFYLLKEDELFSFSFLNSMPEAAVTEARKILKNIDSTLSSYITGLVIVAASVGTMLFIGYLLIGLDSALILAFIALIFTTIPFLGPFLAITPALLVGFSQSLFMSVKVAIVFIIVQQLESNVISPQIIGQRLHIHPLTIILLLLAAGTFFGLPGLLLATPVYAVCKVLFANLYKIYLLRYSAIKENLTKP